MNRSCNSILCRFGIHTADPYVHIQVMVLDNEQAKQLVDYAVKKEVYNWDGVESVVAEALAHGNKVVINADW